MTLTLPALRHTLVADPLKTTVNRIVNTAESLGVEARRERVDVSLHIDLEGRRIWSITSDMTPEAIRDREEEAWHFPKGVRIVGLARFNGEIIRDGEAVVRFYGRGYRDPALLYVARDKDHYTVIFEPFLPRVKVEKGILRRDRDGTYYSSTSL